MKITKFLLSTFCAVLLTFTFSACSASVNTNSAANNANKANTMVVNTNKTIAASTTTPTANVASSAAANKDAVKQIPADESDESEKVDGQLHVGKTGSSYILYVGMETGDYAAYCFANDSEAGRAILAACKDGEQCEVSGNVEEDKGCKAPGLEADLSASGKIVKVQSVKKLAGKK
jgi:hypothetical protein